jgi:hypothetical protein
MGGQQAKVEPRVEHAEGDDETLAEMRGGGAGTTEIPAPAMA